MVGNFLMQQEINLEGLYNIPCNGRNDLWKEIVKYKKKTQIK
jgi:hypothetical protein